MFTRELVVDLLYKGGLFILEYHYLERYILKATLEE